MVCHYDRQSEGLEAGAPSPLRVVRPTGERKGCLFAQSSTAGPQIVPQLKLRSVRWCDRLGKS